MESVEFRSGCRLAYQAFAVCKNLKSVTFDYKPSFDARLAFERCPNLTEFIIEGKTVPRSSVSSAEPKFGYTPKEEYVLTEEDIRARDNLNLWRGGHL